MTLLEVKHYDASGNVIWQEEQVPNLFHQYGEEFLLSLAFDTDAGYTAPTFYYLGMDNRSTIAYEDTIGTIDGEPSTNGYGRQTLSSTSGFSVSLVDGRMRATTGIITFSATGGSWGPVRNLFLATSVDGSGVLLASNALSSTRTLTDGSSMTVRLRMAFT